MFVLYFLTQYSFNWLVGSDLTSYMPKIKDCALNNVIFVTDITWFDDIFQKILNNVKW